MTETTAMQPEPAAAITALEDEPVGIVLKRTREDYGEDLRAVAAALRISRSYLDAIERSRYDELPGQAYASGWIRSYAQYLGLNGDDLVERFQHERREAPKATLTFPEPEQTARAPGLGVVIVGVLLAAAAYGVYALFFQEDGAQTAVSTTPPIEVAAPDEAATPEETASGEAPGDTTTVASPPPTALAPADDQTAAAPVETPAPAEPSEPLATPEPVVISPPSSTPAAEEAAAEIGGAEPPTVGLDETPDDVLELGSLPNEAEVPGEPPAPTVYGDADGRVVLEAAADSWIQVRDTRSGETLLSRILFAGESYVVPDRPGIVMRTGNAGGLRILVDGQEAPSVGPSGAVRSNVQLSPGPLLAGAAYTPPAERAVQPAPAAPVISNPPTPQASQPAQPGAPRPSFAFPAQ